MDAPFKKRGRRSITSSIICVPTIYKKNSQDLEINKEENVKFIIRKMAVFRPSLTFQLGVWSFRNPVGLERSNIIGGWSVES